MLNKDGIPTMPSEKEFTGIVKHANEVFSRMPLSARKIELLKLLHAMQMMYEHEAKVQKSRDPSSKCLVEKDEGRDQEGGYF